MANLEGFWRYYDWLSRIDFAHTLVSLFGSAVVGIAAYFSDWSAAAVLLAMLISGSAIANIYMFFCKFWDRRANKQGVQKIALAYEVEGRIKALNRLHEALEQSGEELYQRIDSLDLPWEISLPWRPSIRRQPKHPTVATVKAAAPQIEELDNLGSQMQREVHAAISPYPYSEYLKQITGFPVGPTIGGLHGSRELIGAIANLKPDDNENYFKLLLEHKSSPFVAGMQQFREWFSGTKTQILQKRHEELASLQKGAP